LAGKIYNLRCIAYPKGERYVGVCLDLSLYAEGDTTDDVRAQLESQVISYMSYIIEKGVEGEMFPRPAPAPYWLRYFVIKTVNLIRGWLFSVQFDPEGYRRAPLFAEVSSP
jgi:hypothetical protein